MWTGKSRDSYPELAFRSRFMARCQPLPRWARGVDWSLANHWRERMTTRIPTASAVGDSVTRLKYASKKLPSGWHPASGRGELIRQHLPYQSITRDLIHFLMCFVLAQAAKVIESLPQSDRQMLRGLFPSIPSQ